MKEIEFIKVGLKNFSCYMGNGLELSFESGKLILITGPNGIGKTTIFDALSYSLYGKTTKGGGGEDVINNVAGKNCLSWTEFKIDGDFYKVSRYVKYSKIGTTVILEKNGVKIKQGHMEVVPYIESIFMPYKLFMNTLMFSQKVKDFFTDLNDSAQKEIFRKILLLEEWLTYQEKAKQKLKIVEGDKAQIDVNIQVKQNIILSNIEAIKRLIEAEKQFEVDKITSVNNLKKDQTETKVKLEETVKSLNEFQAKDPEQQYADLLSHESTLLNQIRTIEEDFNKSKDLIMTRKDLKLSELSKTAQEKQTELQNSFNLVENECKTGCMNELQTVSTEVTKAQQEYNDELHKSELLKAEANRAKNTAQVLKKASSLKGMCPTCMQTLDDDAKISLSKSYLENEELFNKLSKQAEDIRIAASKQFDVITKEYALRAAEINSKYDIRLKSEREKFTKNKTELTTKLQDLIGQVEQLALNEVEKERKENVDSYQKLKLQTQELTKRKETIKAVINTIKDLIVEVEEIKGNIINFDNQIKSKQLEKYDKTQKENLEESSKTIEKEIVSLHERVKQLEKEIKIIDFWKKEGFSSSGIPSMLIDDSIPFMNKRVAEYCDKIAGGRYVVSFDTLKPDKDQKVFKDKINVEIFDTVTKSNKRVKFSGGQTRIVDIATILTLRDLQANFQDMKINILLFDEIFDSLDDENVGYVSKLLKLVAKDTCVVIVSHRHFDAIEADEHFKLGG